MAALDSLRKARQSCFHLLAMLAVVGVSLLAGLTPAAADQRSASTGAFFSPRGAAPPGGKMTSVRLYYIALGDDGRSGQKIGCGDSAVAVTRRIPSTTAPLTAAYTLLLQDHRPYYGQSGLYNALYQARLALKRAVVVNGRALIYLAGRLNLRGECDDPRASTQLRKPAFQFPTVHAVSVYINNVPLWQVVGGRGRGG